MSEYLPVTPQQIIDDAVAAYEAGAAVVHIHGRKEKNGEPTGDPEIMKNIVEEIRKRCNVVIGITTEELLECLLKKDLQQFHSAKQNLPLVMRLCKFLFFTNR